MCPPKTCPCPPAGRLANFGLLKIIGFGLKSALAAGLVYVTYDMGVWGGADDAQQFYSGACALFGQPKPRRSDKWDPPSCEAERDFFPMKPRQGPFAYCDEPPIKSEDTHEKFKSLWNGAVTYVFRGIANLTLSSKDKHIKPEECALKQE